MNSSALSMELSVSFVSWINDQMKDRIEVPPTRQALRHDSCFRGFVVCGVACISMALASLITW
ncbi:MAG: hypothetical protein O2820_24815 [Planctomycetota bacterium]|nr:hypothetical protein [Planctomycetota bacterium]MDA1252436.1 hypothetical protein [Planctomycetota bacterium]